METFKSAVPLAQLGEWSQKEHNSGRWEVQKKKINNKIYWVNVYFVRPARAGSRDVTQFQETPTKTRRLSRLTFSSAATAFIKMKPLTAEERLRGL